MVMTKLACSSTGLVQQKKIFNQVPSKPATEPATGLLVGKLLPSVCQQLVWLALLIMVNYFCLIQSVIAAE